MLTVKHRGNFGDAATENRPSDNIWSRIPWHQIQRGLKPGFFWEFNAGSPAASVFASATVQAGVKTFQDAGVTIGPASLDGGNLQIAGADAAGDDGAIEFMGGGAAGAFSVSSSRLRKVAFEIRLSLTTLAQMGFFAGLVQPGFAAAAALADTTAALSDKHLIGFHLANATSGTTDTVDCSYRKSGGAAQVNGSGVQTLSADTYYKLNLLFTPYATPSVHRLEWFIDNLSLSSFTDIDATTFPDGQYLTPAVALKALDTNEKKMNIAWARACIQL
jgi:hypothetical protein